LNSRFPYISFKANLQNMKEVGLDEHNSWKRYSFAK
jgi:hypothetical protein